MFCDFCRKHNLNGVWKAGAAGYVLRLPDGRESLIGGTCATKHCQLTYNGRSLEVVPRHAKWVPTLNRQPRPGDEARPQNIQF